MLRLWKVQSDLIILFYFLWVHFHILYSWELTLLTILWDQSTSMNA